MDRLSLLQDHSGPGPSVVSPYSGIIHWETHFWDDDLQYLFSGYPLLQPLSSHMPPHFSVFLCVFRVWILWTVHFGLSCWQYSEFSQWRSQQQSRGWKEVRGSWRQLQSWTWQYWGPHNHSTSCGPSPQVPALAGLAWCCFIPFLQAGRRMAPWKSLGTRHPTWNSVFRKILQMQWAQGHILEMCNYDKGLVHRICTWLIHIKRKKTGTQHKNE
jgi:hypothetical protein